MFRPSCPDFSALLLVSGIFLMSVTALTGCHGARSPEPQVPPSQAESSGPGPTSYVRPELTVDEETLKRGLARHLARLSEKGARTPARPWELADASDYIAVELEALGFPVERQGYEVDGTMAQNLTVRIGGGARGDEVIVVGAHYDSPAESAGRNGGAGASAALLELARMMQGAQLSRTLQFSAFSLGESPHGDGPMRGARVFLDAVKEKHQLEADRLKREEEQKARGELPESLPPLAVDESRFVCMISLGRLLSFRPQSLGEAGPLWINVRVGARAQPFAETVLRLLDEPPFLVNPEPLELGRGDSDALAFHEANVPVIELDGSGELEGDDLDALARVVMAMRLALGELAGERPKDGLAPLLSAP